MQDIQQQQKISPEEIGFETALEAQRLRKRRGRSIAIAVSLIVLVLIFYAVTLVKLGPSVLNRPL